MTNSINLMKPFITIVMENNLIVCFVNDCRDKADMDWRKHNTQGT